MGNRLGRNVLMICRKRFFLNSSDDFVYSFVCCLDLDEDKDKKNKARSVKESVIDIEIAQGVEAATMTTIAEDYLTFKLSRGNSVMESALVCCAGVSGLTPVFGKNKNCNNHMFFSPSRHKVVG